MRSYLFPEDLVADEGLCRGLFICAPRFPCAWSYCLFVPEVPLLAFFMLEELSFGAIFPLMESPLFCLALVGLWVDRAGTEKFLTLDERCVLSNPQTPIFRSLDKAFSLPSGITKPRHRMCESRGRVVDHQTERAS